MPEPLTPVWFKSSYSGGSGTECVECAQGSGYALVRDSARPASPIIAVRNQAWQIFICHISHRARA
ncbi:DUF397 domain-containing protein [Streptomyces sp. NPDC102256]|uniref:DUF397 domain-containing protein n=1 Tax=Streptomyces sp. NPDC102256 TaxID=3366147 RepID=UPI0038105179